MITINLTRGSKKNVLSYDSATKTFYGSEKNILFATEYTVVNTVTKESMLFVFSHSTGPEFDPQTQWIYKNSNSNILLIICNDAEITKRNAENYKMFI